MRRISSALDDIFIQSAGEGPDKDETSPSGVHVERFPLEGNNYRMFATMPEGEARGHMMEYSVHPKTKSLKFQKTHHSQNSTKSDQSMAHETMRGFAHDFHPGFHTHNPKYDDEHSPVPTGPNKFYHGTTVSHVTHILPADQHKQQITFPSDTDTSYAYASTKPDDAWDYAKKSWENDDEVNRRPRVYEVRPVGGNRHVEEDPQYDENGKHRFNLSNDFRSKKGWKVVREVPMPEYMGDPEDWEQ